MICCVNRAVIAGIVGIVQSHPHTSLGRSSVVTAFYNRYVLVHLGSVSCVQDYFRIAAS